MSTSQSRRLSELVGVRLLPEEKAALTIEAKKEGISLQTLLRRRAGLDSYDLQPV